MDQISPVLGFDSLHSHSLGVDLKLYHGQEFSQSHGWTITELVESIHINGFISKNKTMETYYSYAYLREDIENLIK